MGHCPSGCGERVLELERRVERAIWLPHGHQICQRGRVGGESPISLVMFHVSGSTYSVLNMPSRAVNVNPMAIILFIFTCRNMEVTPEPPHATSTSLPITHHPTPNTQHPTPSTQHPSPSTQHPTPSTQHPAPSTQHPAPITQHPAPSTHHPTPSTQHPVPTIVRSLLALFSISSLRSGVRKESKAKHTHTSPQACVGC